MKITSRDFLWIVIIFSILLSWWLDHRQQKETYEAAIETSKASVVRIRDLELSVKEARNLARVELEMLRTHDIDLLLEGYDWLKDSSATTKD